MGCKKIKFLTENNAKAVAPHLEKRYNKKYRIYKCSECRYFHLSTSKRKSGNKGNQISRNRQRRQWHYRKYQLPIEVWENEGGSYFEDRD